MDEVTISGIDVLLDEEADPPYLELRLRAGTRSFVAAILATEDLWALNIRDEQNHALPSDGELYATQSDAILAAMLTALHRASPLHIPPPA